MSGVSISKVGCSSMVVQCVVVLCGCYTAERTNCGRSGSDDEACVSEDVSMNNTEGVPARVIDHRREHKSCVVTTQYY